VACFAASRESWISIVLDTFICDRIAAGVASVLPPVSVAAGAGADDGAVSRLLIPPEPSLAMPVSLCRLLPGLQNVRSDRAAAGRNADLIYDLQC
jgi:hypothetical protein